MFVSSSPVVKLSEAGFSSPPLSASQETFSSSFGTKVANSWSSEDEVVSSGCTGGGEEPPVEGDHGKSDGDLSVSEHFQSVNLCRDVSRKGQRSTGQSLTFSIPRIAFKFQADKGTDGCNQMGLDSVIVRLDSDTISKWVVVKIAYLFLDA